MSAMQSDSDRPAGPGEADRRGRNDLIEALGLGELPDDPRLRAAITALGDEVLSLHEEVARLREALRASALLADHDTLCPIFNRRAFMRELKREIALAARFDTPLSVIYMDLDGFKAINDRFGHATGDAVLERVASVLIEDTRDTDIIARLGGDEFGIALPHASVSDASEKARRLSERIAMIRVRPSNDETLPPLRLGASIGVAGWHPELDPQSLVSEADAAMYAAKSASARPRMPG